MQSSTRSVGRIAAALLSLATLAADAASPELSITVAGRTRMYTQESLLAHPAEGTARSALAVCFMNDPD